MWRFVAGLPLDGHYRTDARFWHRGTRLVGTVTVRRWSYLPGYQRSLIRLCVLAAIAAGTVGAKLEPGWTLAAVGVLAASAALYAAVRLFQAVRDHRVTRTYVNPVHAVLAALLGLPPTTRGSDYIDVPSSFRTNEDTPVRIKLPDRFNPAMGNRKMLTDAVLPKLGWTVDMADVTFHLVGNPVMVIKMAPQPPDKVLWTDHVEFMRELEPGQIFVGLGPRSKPYIRDFREGEVVHGGFNVQTGYGKSSAALAWIAQQMGNDPGVLVTFLDPKGSPLPTCLTGVPGYTLYNDPDDVESMWTGIELVEEEMDRRRRTRIEDPTAEFPLYFLYLDELTEFAELTADKWEELREKGQKKTAPIWRSISRLLRLGREYGIRLIMFTQRLDNRSSGGIGLRDYMGWRGLAGFRRNQWLMLIGTLPVPKSINKKGRWLYSEVDRELWVQNVYGTPEQLRDYALSGRRPGDTHRGHSHATRVAPAETLVSVQWDIIGLQAAADYLGIPVGTFRKRRARAEGIPGEGIVGRSPAWMRADLDVFAQKVHTS